MVHHIGSFEAKTRLAELLRLAERGDEVVVMRRGQRIAVIIGASRYDEVTHSRSRDWRADTREWLAQGPGISRSAFDKVLADSKKGRP
jgi:prevent-host-death family protein